MPEEMERKLKAEAAKRGLSKERTGAFVYGTMRKTGWKPDREKHGSLEDITFHEKAANGRKHVLDAFTHPVHKGYAEVVYGELDPPKLDDMGVNQFTKGSQSCNRDAGQGVHYGAPVDYFGPDTDYRAEEIDPYQYGRDYEPIPLRDYFKSEDKMFERGFRAREQDEYDNTPTPGAVTDEQPQTEAYNAVNYQGAGPDKADGEKAGSCDYRSFRSQREFGRTNKDKSLEYAVDVANLDTHRGKDIR
jgi:hypothetical protein